MIDEEDTLTRDIEAAINAAEAKNTAPSEEATEALAEGEGSEPPTKEPEARARDESGKFAKATEKPKGGEKPIDVAAATVAAPEAGKPADAAKIAAVPPPSNWKGAGKIDWNRLPPNIQKALNDDYAETAKTSGELTELRSAIGDRAQAWNAQYGSVGNALKSILAGADMANQNPKGFILWLAQRAGIDLTQMVQGGSQGAQQQQPTFQPNNPYEQKIGQLENQLNSFLQQQQQTTRSTLQAEIDAFAGDSKHPYFNDVRTKMGALMNAGHAKTLQEAYEAACWSDPTIRTSLIEDQQKQAQDANKAKVDAAKKAAGSISGSPAGGKPQPEGKAKRNLDDTIRDAVNAAWG